MSVDVSLSMVATGRRRAGVTLVELLVAIVIVGLLAGVVGLAARRAPQPDEAERLAAAVASARRTALQTGHPVTIELHIDGDVHAITARPDGGACLDVSFSLEAPRCTLHDGQFMPIRWGFHQSMI